MQFKDDLPAGIYFHVPFCLSKCRYCDFYSITSLSNLENYIRAVIWEMERYHSTFSHADTIYLGGGTPSLVPTRFLAKIFERAANYWELKGLREITLEMNPATLDVADMHELKALGINRLNIGIQSFQEQNLRFLGRIHSPKQAQDTIASARRAGFDNLGIDLIFGLPGQTAEQWESDLRKGIDLDPDHLSCYILSYEPDTPLFRSLKSGNLKQPDEDAVSDLFLMTHDILEASGYEHYEISNFAKKGRRSRHNQKYWHHFPYLGLGPSAHSYNHPRRWWNHHTLEHYLNDVQYNRLPQKGKEYLTREQELIEALYLGLRQSDGIDLNGFRQDFGLDFTVCFGTVLNDFIHKKLLVINEASSRLTPEGMLLLDQIVGELSSSID